MCNLISNKDKLKKIIKILLLKEQIPINKVSEILKVNRFKTSRIWKGEKIMHILMFPMCITTKYLHIY